MQESPRYQQSITSVDEVAMSNYYAEDPYENGWGDADTSNPSASMYGYNSGFTASQLLAPSGGGDSFPDQYKDIWSHHKDVSTLHQLETDIFDKAVAAGYITSYQSSKLANVVYDNLVPLDEKSFCQALGLLALEIENKSGDYVTLSFRRGNLPDLPERLVASLAAEPATEQTTASSSTIPAPVEWDPLLADRSSQSLDDPDTNEAPVVNQQNPIDNDAINAYVNNMRSTFDPLAPNAIRIKESPEKEGLVFKHINYTITHSMQLGTAQPGEKKVVRRYSDFVWLLEFLLKKYPFRVIPGLPPKKFTGASPDSQFLQRRRRGLFRFLNQLVKHPVLKQEPVVVTFLTVPTDLATWKRQARIDESIEFKGEKISTHFINSVWPAVGGEFLRQWGEAEQSVAKLIEVWTKLVILVERHEKRQQQIASDNMKFNEMLAAFTRFDNKVYPEDDSVLGRNNARDTPAVNDSMSYVGQFFTKASEVLVDESYTVNSDVLEQFKGYLDYLYSLQELFERTKRLSANNIDTLEAQIKEKEARYNKLNTEAVDARGAQVAKLRQSIVNDKQEIFQQLNRDWLIKQCCHHELTIFQQTQFLVSKVWLDWNATRLRTQQKLVEHQDNLNREIDPLLPLEHR